MKFSKMLIAAGLLAATVATSSARAEYYEYTAVATLSNGVGGTASGSTFTSSAGDTVTVTGTPTSNPNAHGDATFPGTISFATIVANISSTAPRQDPIGFNFSILLTVTDYSAPTGGTALGTGSLTVSGRFSGTIGSGQNINLGAPLLYATNPANGTIAVGQTVYTLNQLTFSGPGGSGNPGSFGGTLSSRANSVPEPGSIALLGMGLAGFGAISRRRKRAAEAAAV